MKWTHTLEDGAERVTRRRPAADDRLQGILGRFARTGGPEADPRAFGLLLVEYRRAVKKCRSRPGPRPVS